MRVRAAMPFRSSTPLDAAVGDVLGDFAERGRGDLKSRRRSTPNSEATVCCHLVLRHLAHLGATVIEMDAAARALLAAAVRRPRLRDAVLVK